MRLNQVRQHLLIDADDTLWENNIYFERAFHQFCDYLDHSTLTREQIRAVLDEVELVNNRVHGYGSANFGRNLLECYRRLVERHIAPSDAAYLMELAQAIEDHPLQILEGVTETLAYLSRRHELILFTKGNPAEQKRKIEKSGLGIYFQHAVVVKEKDVGAYRRLVEERKFDRRYCWMIGNSPKSDINPALEAGLGAVYVPHERTWHLEREAIAHRQRLIIVKRFADLRRHF